MEGGGGGEVESNCLMCEALPAFRYPKIIAVGKGIDRRQGGGTREAKVGGRRGQGPGVSSPAAGQW